MSGKVSSVPVDADTSGLPSESCTDSLKEFRKNPVAILTRRSGEEGNEGSTPSGLQYGLPHPGHGDRPPLVVCVEPAPHDRTVSDTPRPHSTDTSRRCDGRKIPLEVPGHTADGPLTRKPRGPLPAKGRIALLFREPRSPPMATGPPLDHRSRQMDMATPTHESGHEAGHRGYPPDLADSQGLQAPSVHHSRIPADDPVRLGYRPFPRIEKAGVLKTVHTPDGELKGSFALRETWFELRHHLLEEIPRRRCQRRSCPAMKKKKGAFCPILKVHLTSVPFPAD